MNYSKISPDFTIDLYKIVENAHEIVITGHESPDEDAYGSALSVYTILNTKYPTKNIRIILTGEPYVKLNFFKNYDKIEFVKDIAEEVSNTDLLIMLDGSQYSRFSKQPEKLKAISQTICIDHHSSPPDEFSLSLISPQYSSCSEIIYLTFCSDSEVDKELAKIFILGVLADTGNFTYLKPHQTDTLITAKKLLDIGKIEIQEFQSRYRTISKRSFNIIQELIKNTNYGSSNVWPDFQYSFIGELFMNELKLTDNEVSEGCHVYMSNYLRMIDGYTWGFIITPKEDGNFNISGRSLPKSVSVRDLMERMKLGGGHDRAAGGTLNKSDNYHNVSECVEKVIAWINTNDPLIV